MVLFDGELFEMEVAEAKGISFPAGFAKQDGLSFLRKFFYDSFLNAPVGKKELEEFSFSEAGVVAGSLLRVEGSGFEAMPLGRAVEERVADFPPLFSKLFVASASDERHLLLARAFSEPLFVFVADGGDARLKIRYPDSQPPTGVFSSFFNLLVVGDGARVSVVEENRFAGKGVSSTEVVAGQRAQVEFASLHSPSAAFLCKKRFFAGKESRLRVFSGFFGGPACRAETQLVLEGEGAFASDNNACFASGTQFFDLTSNIVHSSPSTKGHSVSKSVLKDAGRSAAWGCIRINKGAKGSDSFLAQKALVLDAGARADATPTLEILENDVRATHSSGVTHLDDEALFYLGSRGLPPLEARKLLAGSFLEGVFDGVSDEGFREAVSAEIAGKWL